MEEISPNRLITQPGRLFQQRAERNSANDPRLSKSPAQQPTSGPPDRDVIPAATYRLTFAAIWLFTLLLYMRPNDLFPAIREFPIAKIVALIAMITYFIEQSRLGRPLINWTIEVKMVFLMVGLAILFIPVAISPRDSFEALSDTYLKTVIFFLLIINVVNTRKRIYSLFKLVVICGAVHGFFAVRSYAMGNLSMQGIRIEGLVGGMFGNPNDLATALAILTPLGITLALTHKGISPPFYLVCTAIMACAVISTFSRAGFLGLILTTFVMLWKFGRGKRVRTIFMAAIVFGAGFVLVPGGYAGRVATIFSPDDDRTGSANQRSGLMLRAAEIALRRPIVGIGMGNFYLYSDSEHAAHNAYLEVAAELGGVGLIAYLILILAPLRMLRRIEDETAGSTNLKDRELHYLTIGIQAAMLAYIMRSFFASIQYLWYLYYTAGYAIALRKIREREVTTSPVNETALSPVNLGASRTIPPPRNKPTGRLLEQIPRGSLWPSHRLQKGINGKAY